MEHDLHRAQKKVWGMLRNRKKPVNEYIQTNTIKPKEWKKHLKTLYEDTEENELEEPYRGNEESEMDYSITEKAIQQATRKLKNRKTPGPDGITNEMIKYGGDALRKKLTTLYNNVIKFGRPSTQWKESIIIHIFKRGTKIDPKNYRGITLLSAVLKLMTKILAERIAQTGICEEQQGFRRNRSTIQTRYS